MQIIEDRVQNRAGPGDAGNFAHRRAVEIPRPDTDGKLRRESDRPVIAKVGARAGFARHRIIEAQGRVHPESERARGIIAENVRDLPDQLGTRIAMDRGRICRQDTPGTKLAEPRQTRVSVCHFQQARLTISEGKAEPVDFRRPAQSR